MVGLRLRLSVVVALFALGWLTVGWQTVDQLAAENTEEQPVTTSDDESKPSDSESTEKEDDAAKDESKKEDESKDDKDKKSDADEEKDKKKSASKDSKSKTAKKKVPPKKTPAKAKTATRQPTRSGNGSSGTSVRGGAGAGGLAGANSAGASKLQAPTLDAKAAVKQNSDIAKQQGAGGAKKPSKEAMARVFEIQKRYTNELRKQEGVVSIGTRLDSKTGQFKIAVGTSGAGDPQIPATLDGVPVEQFLTGLIHPLQLPAPTTPTRQTRLPRPIPIGVSGINLSGVCGSACATGTIGCRLKARDGSGYYALSNNHVFADANRAPIGSIVTQPGPGDNNCVCVTADSVGTLAKIGIIDFSLFASNKYDAAIIKTDPSLIGNSTLPDGYGTPKSRMLDLPDDNFIINLFYLLIDTDVQKYGRTTGQTAGIIFFVNVTSFVGPYQNGGIARFDGQIDVVGTRGAFGGPGDSGSLVVNKDRYPVGLLFAGSSAVTVISPIAQILNDFEMDIDGEGGPAPPPGKNGKGQPNTP